MLREERLERKWAYFEKRDLHAPCELIVKGKRSRRCITAIVFHS
jgi:hypothetical protein